MEIQEYFANLCRICMARSSKHASLFENLIIQQENLAIAEYIAICTDLKIKREEHLPLIVCSSCLEQLIIAYAFKKRCLHSDQIFRQLLRDGSGTNVAKPANFIGIKNSFTDANSSVACKINLRSVKREKTVPGIEHARVSVTLPSKDDFLTNTASVLAVNSDLSSTCIRNNFETKFAIKDAKCTQEIDIHCSFCLKTFKSQAALAVHVKIHDNGAQLACKICPKTFLQPSKLKRHMRIHAEPLKRNKTQRKLNVNRIYPCEACNKDFTSKAGLAYHRSIHTGIKNFSCDLCNKKFVARTNLILHKRRHNREFTHLCSECGKKFLTLGELTRHTRKHTQEQPFSCPICQKRFTTNVSLTQHKMRHEGIKLFLCCVCSKRFTTTGNLTEHMLSHTGVRPHVCTVCSKGCISTSDLKKHLRTHSGEKPYVCHDCGRGFARSGSLKVHMRTHTGLKPYECEKCGKKFGHSGSLAKHARKHLNVE